MGPLLSQPCVTPPTPVVASARRWFGMLLLAGQWLLGRKCAARVSSGTIVTFWRTKKEYLVFLLKELEMSGDG